MFPIFIFWRRVTRQFSTESAPWHIIPLVRSVKLGGDDCALLGGHRRRPLPGACRFRHRGSRRARLPRLLPPHLEKIIITFRCSSIPLQISSTFFKTFCSIGLTPDKFGELSAKTDGEEDEDSPAAAESGLLRSRFNIMIIWQLLD